MTTVSIMTHRIDDIQHKYMTLSIMPDLLCLVLFMLRVTNNQFMLSVIMLSVVQLSVIMLSVVMLSVVMLSVIMLIVMAPFLFTFMQTFLSHNGTERA
jgi:hypothetical protein